MEEEGLAFFGGVDVINFCFKQTRKELLDQLSSYTKLGHSSAMYVANGINKIYCHAKGGSSCKMIRNTQTC